MNYFRVNRDNISTRVSLPADIIPRVQSIVLFCFPCYLVSRSNRIGC